MTTQSKLSNHHQKEAATHLRVFKDATLAQLLILAVIMVAAIIAATGMGYIKLSANDVIKIIFARIRGQDGYRRAAGY